MAWPSTPLTTYVPVTTPAIKSFDLNSFQSGINGIINGTYSLNAAVIDGAGGAITAPVAGTLNLTVPGGLAGVGGPPCAPGTGYKESLLLGAAAVNAALGAPFVWSSYNVDHVVNTGLGDYTVVFSFIPPGTSFRRASVWVTNMGAQQTKTPLVIKSLDGANHLNVRVQWVEFLGVQDVPFDIGVFGI